MKKIYYYIVFGILFASMIQIFTWLIQYNKSYLFPEIKEFNSMSYTPYKGFERNVKSKEELLHDFKILEKHTKKIRTYSIEDSKPLFPMIMETTLKIDLGIWLGSDKEKNAIEFKEAKELIEKYPTKFDTIIVGNEAILRKDVNVEELTNYLIKAKQMFPTYPITTAETWYFWATNLQLSEHVDIVYMHILPYWESVSKNDVLDYAKDKIEMIKDLFEDKIVYIGEFGYPSRGYNNHSSEVSPELQAYLIRNFVSYAQLNDWGYNIVDAFDQPWKGKHEGSVGAYWGVFNVDGELKFTLNGVYQENENWIYQLIIAIILGCIYTYIGLRNQILNLNHTIAFSLTAQAMAFGNVQALFYPFLNYMSISMYIIWGLGTLMLIPLTVITLIKVNEIFKCTIGVKPQRTIEKLKLNKNYQPFVSVHVPAYRENPKVLIETLESLMKLDYPNYEVVVIINNTPEEHYKDEVKEYCDNYKDKIVYLDIVCTGFKAGAMNEAIKYTSPKTEVLAVIDADYCVEKDWLKDLCPVFENPNVAIVQAPQDHRDYKENLLKTAMNFEYAGFFDIGMVERNETNSIIVHGTMLLINYKAFNEVGGWTTDTIVEDTELGMRLFEAGYEMYYSNKRYGYGLLPDNLKAFKTQRHRWVFGSVQIFKKHFKHLSPMSNTLTSYQKFNYLVGWSYWFLEGLSSFITLINLIWIPFMIYFLFMIPTIPLVLPIIAAFFVNILHSFILYKVRVKANFWHTFLSAITSMSLQLTIMRAIVEGFTGKKMEFKRTEKGGNTLLNQKFSIPIKSEIFLFVGLIFSAWYFFTHNWMGITEMKVFAYVLLIQSVPYGSAIILHIIDVYKEFDFRKILGWIKNEIK